MRSRPAQIALALAGLWLLVYLYFELFPGRPPAGPAPAALQKQDTTVGKGKEALRNSTVLVNYEGRLTDGTVFDSTKKHGEPYTVSLGTGSVIKGWDEGIPGMREGGKRRLTIPPALGYGDQGSGSQIPPNSTLVFDIELLKVQSK